VDNQSRIWTPGEETPDAEPVEARPRSAKRLDFGRDERLFSRAQRRAIRFRHGNVCCVKGCERRITQIHHLDWWEHGGETNVA
jgi:hypothetical protein